MPWDVCENMFVFKKTFVCKKFRNCISSSPVENLRNCHCLKNNWPRFSALPSLPPPSLERYLIMWIFHTKCQAPNTTLDKYQIYHKHLHFSAGLLILLLYWHLLIDWWRNRLTLLSFDWIGKPASDPAIRHLHSIVRGLDTAACFSI